MKIRELHETEKPLEKLILLGPESLSIVELLAIIIRVGTKEKNVIELSREILNEFDFEKISRRSYVELLKFKGISKVKSSQIVALFEISRRINQSEIKLDKIRIQNADDVYNIIKFDFMNLEIEKIMIVLVNSKNQVIKKEFIFEGSINFSYIDVRKVLKKVFDYNASGFFLIHNHPSGDSTPSNDDIEITTKIRDIALSLNVRFLDHIIVGNSIFSFFDDGNIF